jgi:hypothetical protein
MEISDTDFLEANRRGAEERARFPAVIDVRFDRRISRVVLSLSSGIQIAFAPRHVQGLEGAHPADFDGAEISPSGLGVHFPLLDADIYVPGLLQGLTGSKDWMASHLGKLGGKVSSPAKAAAARENGKRGGRPPKVKAA